MKTVGYIRKGKVRQNVTHKKERERNKERKFNRESNGGLTERQKEA